MPRFPRQGSGDKLVPEFQESFPEACSQASQLVRESLAEGLKTLFLQDHHHLVEPAVRFLARRIGAEAIVCGEA